MAIFNYLFKTIIIFGSSGFIGSNLCRKLLKENPKKIIIVDNLCQSNLDNIQDLLKDERVEFHNLDIRDKDNIESLILQSDYIFHLAASDVGSSVLYPKFNVETNVVGTLNILMSMLKKPDIRMVYVSSGSVVNPSTVYAISKMAAENLVKFYVNEYGLKISTIRPYHVFGPCQNIFGTSGVINKFLYRILKGESPILWGDGEAVKCFTFVGDVINAILLLADNKKTIGHVYDVASETRISIKKLAELLIEKYAENKKIKLIYDKPKIGENLELYPFTDEIKKLGWKEEYSFEHGLDITKEWVKTKLN